MVPGLCLSFLSLFSSCLILWRVLFNPPFTVSFKPEDGWMGGWLDGQTCEHSTYYLFSDPSLAQPEYPVCVKMVHLCVFITVSSTVP